MSNRLEYLGDRFFSGSDKMGYYKIIDPTHSHFLCDFFESGLLKMWFNPEEFEVAKTTSQKENKSKAYWLTTEQYKFVCMKPLLLDFMRAISGVFNSVDREKLIKICEILEEKNG